MNTYLVEAFVSQQAADKCRKYDEINSIISVNLRMEDWH